jgi:SprT protein
MKRFLRVHPSLESQVRNKMEDALNLCRSKNPNTHIPSPELKFRQMGQTAGLCNFNFTNKTGFLTINPDYFTNHREEMLKTTIPHEVAHYVADFLFGRTAHGHGHFWRLVMSWLELPPDRCHQFSLEGVKCREVSRPYKYTCGCDTPHMFTAHSHKKVQHPRILHCFIVKGTHAGTGPPLSGIFQPHLSHGESLY